MLYMSDPGYMVMTEEERPRSSVISRNGGFVWVDDFWGDAEWQQFANVMRQVLPGREWRVLTPDHPIFHTVFDLKEDAADPGAAVRQPRRQHRRIAGCAQVSGRLAGEPQMRAWLDDDGRIMVLATHNTDVGDGWEREAYGEWYFETFSTQSYMVGVNVVVYAMTH